MIRQLVAGFVALALCGFGGVVPAENINPPTPASANGFSTLAMNQDAFTGFDIDQTGTVDGHMWHNGLWQDAPFYYHVASTYISRASDGTINLRWDTSFESAGCPIAANPFAANCPVAIISTAANGMTSGRGFGHGYYEWVFRVTPSSTAAWAASWILGMQTGTDCMARGYSTTPIGSPTAYSEIDAPEWSFTNDLLVHESYNYSASNSDCGKVPPNVFTHTVNPSPDPTTYHKMGLLWCGSSSTGTDCTGTARVCYYIDDAAQVCTNTNAGTEAQLHMINAWLAEQCSGTANSGSCSPPSQIDMFIQSIRYWSCPTWQTNALAC